MVPVLRLVLGLTLCLSLAGLPLPSMAASGSGAGSLWLASETGDVVIGGENTRVIRREPGVRPQRYVCVIDQSGSIGGTGQAQCPASPGRVGGRCRCANVTGSGTLYTY